MAGIETRKVQITGRSTFVVSLPKKWVKKVNIESGDSLVLMPLADGTLLVNPKLSKQDVPIEEHVELEPQDMDDLTRTFIGAYLAGYDVITIKGHKQLLRSMRRNIRDLSHKVIGMEIIDDGNHAVTVKDLLDASDLSLLKGIKRMYSITRNMLQDSLAALTENDADLADDVTGRDDQVDKLFWLIAKQYNLIVKNVFFASKMDIKPQEALGYLLIGRSVERIADHASKIARNAKNVDDGKAVIEDIATAGTELIDLLDDTLNAFYLNKLAQANTVVSTLEAFQQRIEPLKEEVLSSKADAAAMISLAYIIDSLERTRSYATDIAEAAINHYFAANG